MEEVNKNGENRQIPMCNNTNKKSKKQKQKMCK
jgi:hypothetical protein